MKAFPNQADFPEITNLDSRFNPFSIIFKMLLIAVSALLIFFLTSRDYNSASHASYEMLSSETANVIPPTPY